MSDASGITRSAGEHLQFDATVLREGVHGDVTLGEHDDDGHAWLEAVHGRLAHNVEPTCFRRCGHRRHECPHVGGRPRPRVAGDLGKRMAPLEQMVPRDPRLK